MNRLQRYLNTRANDDGGFTLIELAVSLGILSIVMTLAFSILVSTMNISSVVSWQSTSNSELRQLIDSVFADIETARPSLGCDRDRNGKIDLATTSTEKAVTYGCNLNSVIEQSDGVLLVASPDRICYNTNRFLSRQVGTPNPAYAPVCLAVVNNQLLLQTFTPPASTDLATDWNTPITSGGLIRPVAGTRVLGRVDPKATTAASGDGYFEYFKAGDSGSEKIAFTDMQLVQVGNVSFNALKDPERKAVNTVVLRARIAYGETGAQSNRTRDIAYRVALRAARYSSERCGTGNIDAGTSC
jgi:prepilin-type N-terminal cleavage/methylation domain-containing protein